MRLLLPDGWTAGEVDIELGPREQKTFKLQLTPAADAVCRRQPVALDLTVDGQPFGQVAEALVTVRGPRF